MSASYPPVGYEQVHGGGLRAIATKQLGGDPNLSATRDLLTDPARELPSRASPDEALHLTDLGNAHRMTGRSGSLLRYCRPQGAWYIWDGTRWKFDVTGEVFALAKETILGIWDEIQQTDDTKQKDAIAKWAKESESVHRIKAMVELASTEEGIPIVPADLDSDPYLLNVANGTIDLRTVTLEPHDRADMITRICPVPFDADARSDLWESYLEVVQPDQEARAFIQRLAGYSLIGRNTEEILVFGWGPTRSGKGTFAEAVKSALGEYAGTADFASFLRSRDSKGGDRPRGDLVRLQGRRVITSMEVDEGKGLAEGLVKNLTGGDSLANRDLFQKGMEVQESTPSYTLWLMANYKPRVNFEDDAIWTRILLVGFPHHIPEAERRPEVKERLRDPAESGAAVLAWMLCGLKDYLERGLDPPESVRAATTAWRTEMDPIKPFIEECCVVGPERSTSYKMLMDAYTGWCEVNAIAKWERLSKAKLTPLLKSAGYSPKLNAKGRIEGWFGLSVE